jgi:hypothetical protein
MELNNISNFCIFKNEGCPCNIKSIDEYGGFCKKHRKHYLIKDDYIVLEHFTSNIKDYTAIELKKYYLRYVKSKKHSKFKKYSKFKKDDYFNEIKEIYDNLCHLKNNTHIIIKLQSYIRRNMVLSKIKLQGIALFIRHICNNDEDFYTYETKYEIESKYFFSYKDHQNNYWCFDIRSLKKLIDMNYDNPYTIQPIPHDIKIKVNQFVNILSSKNESIVINSNLATDRKTLVKQKYVDLFSQIEYSGYSCDVNWILDLNTHKLKKLYRELEDIWNYRANLSQQVKMDIVPPNGRLFVMPVSDYTNCNSKLELREILANELIKVLGATSQANMNLAFMYIIIGLSIVSHPCYLIHHEWVQYVF